MRKFKYQMHTHTSPCSRCGRLTPTELADSLFECGYSGAVITNHFLGGNTGIDRSLPWRDFVYEYERDYLACRDAARKYRTDIFFGIEEHLGEGLEVLIYGITPDVLYAHPELKERDRATWHRVINSHGGVVIQAHPFREASYILKPRVLEHELIDGIEVYNHSNLHPSINERAAAYAEGFPHLITTSGADAHTTSIVGRAGIYTTRKITSEADLASILRSRSYELIKG